MRYILYFLIIVLVECCQAYIPNCKFILTPNIKMNYIINVIPKNKFCCDALLPECIICQEEAINGISIDKYCDIYAFAKGTILL